MLYQPCILGTSKRSFYTVLLYSSLYQGTEIGECAQFKFGFYGLGKIEGNVTYADLPPEMDINVLFRDGSVTVCTMNDTKLDGNVANEPKFLDFVCKEPKGISWS